MDYKSNFSKDLDTQNPTKNTEYLFNEIKEATNIYTFLKENNLSLTPPTFGEYLNLLLTTKNIKKTQLLYVSGLSRSFIYALLKGDRIPSRDSVINLSFCT